MNEKYHFEYEESASKSFETLLYEGLNKEAARAKGLKEIITFAIQIKNGENFTLGGIEATAYYGCLYIELIWLDPSLRHHGIGEQLVHKAEEIGKEKDCTFSTVDTMDWEALPFYQKLGYEIEFIRSGYAKDSKMYMLRKNL